NKKKIGSTVVDVLKSRLLELPSGSGLPSNIVGETQDYIQGLTTAQVEEMTGDASLWVIDQVNQMSLADKVDDPPSIGLRDLSTLKTLVAIAFRWAINTRLDRVLRHWSHLSSDTAGTSPSGLVEVDPLTDIKNVYDSLSGKTQRLLLPLLNSQQTSPPTENRPIAFLIIPQHVTPLLKACIALGWGPDKSESMDMKSAVYSVLEMVPTSQAIASLGGILAQFNLPTLRSTCGQLLSEQLLKPEGVRGLFSAVLGDDPSIGEAVPLAKLEHVARVLGAVPSTMTTEDYFHTTVPRILAILTDSQDPRIQTPTPQSHKRAAAFAISRMLSVRTAIVSRILSDILQSPFFPPRPTSEPQSVTPSLQTLQVLFSHSDPSPTLPMHLLGPILGPLYALLATLDEVRTSDPALKELVKGLVRLWGRTVATEDAVKGWWKVIESGDGWGEDVEAHWEVIVDDAKVNNGPATIDIDSVLNGDDEEGGLQLTPNPKRLVSLLKTLDRKEVAAALLVRALDQYQAFQAADQDPLKTLFYLRIVMEMVEQLGSTVLSDPQHVLSFVSHSIRAADESSGTGKVQKPRSSSKTPIQGIAGLRIVGQHEDEGSRVIEAEEDEDSDDEGPNDLIATALNLLLATLEANESMTPLNTPLLQIILSDLEPLTLHSSSTIRPLAREARLVLTARNASTSTGRSTGTTAEDDPKKAANDTYQQALKLLQDPILPVRAHGLVLLRQLIVPPKGQPAPPLDPALVPAILSIFLQSVQEDDSYIFLNAVKGLVAMVDRLGRDIMKGLMDVYAGGLLDGRPNSGMGKAELDKRVRVGEALNQSITKCGDALGLYVDILVSPLFHMVRLRDIPTSLRSSALSLLAQCASASPSALIPWAADLCSGMLELLQLEGVSTGPPETRREAARPAENEADPAACESGESTDQAKQSPGRLVDRMDSEPLSLDPKLAPFRRSALHFLSTLLRTTAQQGVDNRQDSGPYVSLDAQNFKTQPRARDLGEREAFPVELIRRMRIVLGYVRATDVDPVVKVMAGETLQLVTELELARLGILGRDFDVDRTNISKDRDQFDPIVGHPLNSNEGHRPPAAPQPHPYPNNFHYGMPEGSEVEPYPRPHPDDVAREARALKMARGTNAQRLAKGLPPLPPVRSREIGRPTPIGRPWGSLYSPLVLSTMMQSVLNSMHDNDPPQPEASSSSGAQRNSSTPSSSSVEPPPVPSLGPDYYELRRQQWLRPVTPSPPADANASNDAQSTTSSSSSSGTVAKKNKGGIDSSRVRLESLLSAPGAEEDDELWRTYLHTVHDGLVGGKRFKKGIKLAVAVKILKAGWLRDGTWDTAAAASMNSIPTSSVTAAGPSNAVAQAASPTGSSRRHSSISTPTTGISASRGLRALLTGGRHQYRHTQHASIASSLPPPSQLTESPWTETTPNTPITARGQVTPPTSAGSTKSTFFNTTISRFLPSALVGKFVSSSAGEKRRHGRQNRSDSWPVLTKEPVATLPDEQGGGAEGIQNRDEEALAQDKGTVAASGQS
ncbi:hypothetical protein FRC01_001559, partial [Tulasnella sp. 417]